MTKKVSRETLKTFTLISTLQVVLGTCGVVNSGGELADPRPPAPKQALPESPTNEEVDQAIATLVSQAPFRPALVVAKLLVSGLLLVAGLAWTTQRISAPMWTAQAAIGNFLWSLASTASDVGQTLAHRARFITLFRSRVASLLSDGDGTPLGHQDVSEITLLTSYLGGIVLFGLVRCGFYMWLFFRARREDLVNLLAERRP